jgi:hypothetical protein
MQRCLWAFVWVAALACQACIESGDQGPIGPDGLQGPQGPAGTLGWGKAEGTCADCQGTYAECASDQVVLGGGCALEGSVIDTRLVATYPASDRRWQCQWTAGGPSTTFRTWAICGKPN